MYQAASLALVTRLGTWIVPSGLSPSRSRSDRTPIAGMVTDTGTERRSDGPRARSGPIVPAAEAAGAGACCWARIAIVIVSAPPNSSATPAHPASLARPRPRVGGLGAYGLSSGHDMTTRSPPMRGHLPIAVPFPLVLLA